MPLTKLETLTLTQYIIFLDKPPTMKYFLGASLKTWFLLTLVSISGAAVCYWVGAHQACYLLLGIGIGSVVRDYSYLRALLKITPVFLQIIDRQKIEKLLGQS